jgi:uncharacterized protein (TIGR03067 family)
MRFALLLFVGALLPSGASAVQTAPEALLGVWQAVSLEDGGRTAPEELVQTLRWTVTEGGIKQEAGGETLELTYTLDPTQSPIWMDLAQGGDVSRGILKIEGDTLTVCWSEATGAQRSTAFESRPDGPNDVLIVFERQ